MVKKVFTYADKANEIKKKYPRADWDAIERKDMVKELRALRDEHEQDLMVMGIADHADKMDGQKEMPAGGELFDATLFNNIASAWKASNYQNNSPGSVLNSVGNDININATKSSEVNTTIDPKYQSIQSNVMPFAVSAGASLLWDAAGLMNAKKNMPKQVNLPRVAPYSVNMEPQRQSLTRDYNTTKNIMLRNSRDVSSPANAYANQVAGLSSLADSYGNQMGQSYMTEANTNAQMGQQRNTQNAQIGSQEALYNSQLKSNNAQVQNQYVSSMFNTIPQALKDYRQQVSQDTMMNVMGKDYGLYEPINNNMTFKDKITRGLLGPQYQMLNRQNPYIKGN